MRRRNESLSLIYRTYVHGLLGTQKIHEYIHSILFGCPVELRINQNIITIIVIMRKQLSTCASYTFPSEKMLTQMTSDSLQDEFPPLIPSYRFNENSVRFITSFHKCAIMRKRPSLVCDETIINDSGSDFLVASF